MIGAVVAPPRLAGKAQASGVVAAPLERLGDALLFLALGDVLFVIVALLQVPDGRPAVVRQVRLILRVQVLEHFGRLPAQRVVVGRQVGEAPVGQLVRIVNLSIETTRTLSMSTHCIATIQVT